jgi:hypothetical protein
MKILLRKIKAKRGAAYRAGYMRGLDPHSTPYENPYGVFSWPRFEAWAKGYNRGLVALISLNTARVFGRSYVAQKPESEG